MAGLGNPLARPHEFPKSDSDSLILILLEWQGEFHVPDE
jgi:hypothetical protein